jgi:hypothetical protein
MSNDNIILPDEISLTEEALAEMDKRPVLPEGVTCYFRIVEAVKGEQPKNGHLYMQFRVVPLRDATDADSGIGRYATNHRFYLPTVNPNRPGHEAPKTKGFVVEFLRAVLGTDRIPNGPGWNKDLRLSTSRETGEVISKDEANEMRQAVDAAVAAETKALWKSPGSVEGMCFVATTKINDRGYLELYRLRPEPIAAEPLTDLSDF